VVIDVLVKEVVVTEDIFIVIVTIIDVMILFGLLCFG
jgi:hypothetical protein